MSCGKKEPHHPLACGILYSHFPVFCVFFQELSSKLIVGRRSKTQKNIASSLPESFSLSLSLFCFVFGFFGKGGGVLNRRHIFSDFFFLTAARNAVIPRSYCWLIALSARCYPKHRKALLSRVFFQECIISLHRTEGR